MGYCEKCGGWDKRQGGSGHKSGCSLPVGSEICPSIKSSIIEKVTWTGKGKWYEAKGKHFKVGEHVWYWTRPDGPVVENVIIDEAKAEKVRGKNNIEYVRKCGGIWIEGVNDGLGFEFPESLFRSAKEAEESSKKK